MAKTEGKGSILLKLIILILAVVLVLVIIIPGRIWQEEEREAQIAHSDMSSIYESEKFYHSKFDSFTTNPTELMNGVRQDSVILQRQKIVNYTTELTVLIDDYLNNPVTDRIIKVHDNIAQIISDLDVNARDFKLIEEIYNEGEQIRFKLSELNNASDLKNYMIATTYLDSIVSFRRDMSNYSLQTTAARTTDFTDTLKNVLPKVEFTAFQDRWKPLSDRLEKFYLKVRHSKVSTVTSVDARLEDFKKKVDRALINLNSNVDISQASADANNISDQLKATYDKFLNDYIVTSKNAMFKLSNSDSLILHLTEDNFTSPVYGKSYIVLIDDDSAAIKVESPVLFEELNEKTMNTGQKIKALDIQPAMMNYKDTLNYLVQKAYSVRKRVSKNTDIFILYKEMEEIRDRFLDISMFKAYDNVNNFVQTAENSKSYSDLKGSIENGLNGIRIYYQAYDENIYGNLDTLHQEMTDKLIEFNEKLDEVRWLPKDVENFEGDMQNLDQLLNDIKVLKSEQLVTKLGEIEIELGEHFVFSEEGTTVPVYGVFEKRIQNHGYIYKDVKSWEEEDED
ncbi:MAG: hypothetical protein GF313_08950 [Caldithrix sp.]|nr:hypothetical protein [Caldithrix sp.]